MYGDPTGAAEINFTPAGKLAAVTNAFRMILENDVVLDGFVMWTEGESRPYATLTYKCPDGDVTGEEMEACTFWQGVVYTVDGSGAVRLLPEEAHDAPPTLLFPDLGPTLKHSAAYGPHGFTRIPGDVFALKGCQE